MHKFTRKPMRSVPLLFGVGVFGLFALVSVLNFGQSRVSSIQTTAQDARVTGQEYGAKPVAANLKLTSEKVAPRDEPTGPVPPGYPSSVSLAIARFDTETTTQRYVGQVTRINPFKPTYTSANGVYANLSATLLHAKALLVRELLVAHSQNLDALSGAIVASFPQIIEDCPSAAGPIGSYYVQVIDNIRAQYVQQTNVIDQQVLSDPSDPEAQSTFSNVLRVVEALDSILNAKRAEYFAILRPCYAQ